MTLLELAFSEPNAATRLEWVEETPTIFDLGPIFPNTSLHLYAGRTQLANDEHSMRSIVDPEGFWDWPLEGPWVDTVLNFSKRNQKLPNLVATDFRTLSASVQRVSRDCMRDSDVVLAHGLAAVVPWLVAARPYLALVDGRSAPIDDPFTLRASMESIAVLCRDSSPLQRLGEFGIEATELPTAREQRRKLISYAASTQRHAVAGFDSLRQKRLELQYEAASADGYDAKYHAALAYREMDRRIAAAIAGAVRRNGATVDLLDVGCGPGSLVPALREIGKVNVVGIDLSPEMIELARARYPDARFEVGDVEALAFPDASFDVVLCSGMLHHLASLRGAMTQIARVLRPGGIMLAREPNEDNFGHRYPELAFAHLCLMHGLYYAMNRDVVYEPDSHDYHRDFKLCDLASEIGSTLRVERVWTDLRVSYFYEMLTEDVHASLLSEFETTLGDAPGLNALILARKPASTDAHAGLTPEAQHELASFEQRTPLKSQHFASLLEHGARLFSATQIPRIPSESEFSGRGLKSLTDWMALAKKILVVCDSRFRERSALPAAIAARVETASITEFLAMREDARVDFLILFLKGEQSARVIAHALRVCRPHGVLYVSLARVPPSNLPTGASEAALAELPYAVASVKRTDVSFVAFPSLFNVLDLFKAIKVAAEAENGRAPGTVEDALMAKIDTALAKAALEPGYSRLRALENGRNARELLIRAGFFTATGA